MASDKVYTLQPAATVIMYEHYFSSFSLTKTNLLPQIAKTKQNKTYRISLKTLHGRIKFDQFYKSHHRAEGVYHRHFNYIL